MSQAQRPLSPHLQIYKWQLTSVLSIIHRGTGLALAVGTFFLVWWLFAAAFSPSWFGLAEAFWYSWLGRLLLLGWTFSFFFHLCNGIRHLFWDSGWGFDLKTTYLTGWIVVSASIFLTLIAWGVAYAVRG
jgi:succinate dehydrogenase / fumarate reductase, cytochrome b subunit